MLFWTSEHQHFDRQQASIFPTNYFPDNELHQKKNVTPTSPSKKIEIPLSFKVFEILKSKILIFR